MPSRQERIEFQVGLFIMGVVAAVLGLIVFAAFERELLARKVSFTVVGAAGDAIDRGVPVKISGVRVGTVSDVDLDDVKTVRFTLAVGAKHAQWFRKSTTIAFTGGSPLLGPAALVVHTNPDDLDIAPKGHVFPLIRDQQGPGPVFEQAKITLERAQKLLDKLNDPSGNVQTLLANLKEASTALNHGNGTARLLLNDPETVAKIRSILAQAAGVAQDLKTVSASAEQSIPKRLPAILTRAQNLVDELNAVAQKVKPAAAKLDPIADNLKSVSAEAKNATKDLPRLRSKVEGTLDSFKGTSDRLSKTWPLSSHD